MSAFERIGLGTVQFGLPYGVSNRAGQPSDGEVADILSGFAASGGRYVDTAVSYGNAEARLGLHRPAVFAPRMISKLPAIAAEAFTSSHVGEIVDAIAGSLDRLKIDRLYGILLHHASDLAKPGWQFLLDALNEARARGLVDRVGASVYDAGELELVESRMRAQIVQLPFNVLDRRLLASGWLDRLKAGGAEIHVRSVFLQGLLLMAPPTLPAFFDPVKARLSELESRWTGAGLTQLAGCLAYALAQKNIDVVIVGVNSRQELDQIAAAAAQIEGKSLDFGPDPRIDLLYLDPRRWPPKSH